MVPFVQDKHPLPQSNNDQYESLLLIMLPSHAPVPCDGYFPLRQVIH